MANIVNEPRDWGAGHHYTQYDMDELEIRKVRALERIADALDGHQTSKWSGNVSDMPVQAKSESRSKPASGSKSSGSLFDCFKF